MPWTATYYRRQNSSPVLGVRALGRPATAVSRVGIVVIARGIAAGVVVCLWCFVVHASITNPDCPLGYAMASGAVPGATVNGVLVVEAPAGGVSLDDLVTHGDWS